MASEEQKHKSSRSCRGGLPEEKGRPRRDGRGGSFQAKGGALQSYRTEAGGMIARRKSCISYFSRYCDQIFDKKQLRGETVRFARFRSFVKGKRQRAATCSHLSRPRGMEKAAA